MMIIMINEVSEQMHIQRELRAFCTLRCQFPSFVQAQDSLALSSFLARSLPVSFSVGLNSLIEHISRDAN